MSRSEPVPRPVFDALWERIRTDGLPPYAHMFQAMHTAMCWPDKPKET